VSHLIQDEAATLLTAAASSPVMRALDLRGVALSGAALDAARLLLLTSPTLQTLRVTAACEEGRDLLVATAARAPHQVALHVNLPVGAADWGSGAGGGPKQHTISAPDGSARVAYTSDAAVCRGRAHEFATAGRKIPAVHAPELPARKASMCSSVGSRGASASRRQPFQSVTSNTPSLKPRVSTLPTKMHGRAHAAGISAGGAADRAAMAFLRADEEGAGLISSAKVARALNELGLLSDLLPGQVLLFLACCIAAGGIPSIECCVLFASALCSDASVVFVLFGSNSVHTPTCTQFDGIQVATALAREAKLSLRNSSGMLTFSEFLACYERLERWLEQQAREGRILAQSTLPTVPPGWHDNKTLRKAFVSFCRFGVPRSHRVGQPPPPLVMSSQQWAKLCCDSGLLEPEGPLPLFAVDVIFAMCKPQKQRRLVYKTFLQALACVGREVGMTFAEVAAKMGCSTEPLASLSRALRSVPSIVAEV
jgi:hypothetical protein